jgi:hypothetical protein
MFAILKLRERILQVLDNTGRTGACTAKFVACPTGETYRLRMAKLIAPSAWLAVDSA